MSSSLFIAYDAGNSMKSVVKLIDFDRYEVDETIQEDKNITEGLEHLLSFLEKIS